MLEIFDVFHNGTHGFFYDAKPILQTFLKMQALELIFLNNDVFHYGTHQLLVNFAQPCYFDFPMSSMALYRSSRSVCT